MQIEGNINFPKQGLPTRKGDEEDSGRNMGDEDEDEEEDDDDKYMQDIMKQQEKQNKGGN